MQDISKLCADSLRAYVGENHGIKLGAAHAHELVAANFGYESRAALLADTKYPLSNLKAAETVISPPLDVLELRIKRLLGESPALPDARSLAERIYSVLVAEKWILGAVFSSFEELATLAAKEHLDRRWKKFGLNSTSIKLDIDVDVDLGADSVLLTALISRPPSEQVQERLRELKVSIKIPRVAANLGYGKLQSRESRYTGGARKMSVPDDVIWPWPAPER
ncbi:MAG TPA: hypothetical protein VK914_03270 [bacterium]|jgi:hypothetical protein|nr:hypothetical protein [bacterium]